MIPVDISDELDAAIREYIPHIKSPRAFDNNKACGMKDWAFKRGYSITTIRVPRKVKGFDYYLQLTKNRSNKLLFAASALTEYGVVVQACEYILKRVTKETK